MPRRYSLTVEGMHCAACAETVANALRKVTGVKRALVNFARSGRWWKWTMAWIFRR